MDKRATDRAGMTALQDFWIKHAQQCVQWNGTVKDYALQHGLKPQELYHWRSWFRKEGLLEPLADHDTSAFRSLTVVGTGQCDSGDTGHAPLNTIAIQLPNQVRFEFSGTLDMRTLEALLRHAADLP